MMVRILLGMLLLVMLLIFSGLGHAQMPPQQQMQCGTADQIITSLNRKFGEAAIIELMGKDGKFVLRLFANPQTQTWTLVAFGTQGMACVAGEGQGVTTASKQKEGAPL
jgi:hypothetical protein